MMLVDVNGRQRVDAWQMIEPGEQPLPGHDVMMGWHDWLARDLHNVPANPHVGLLLKSDDPIDDVVGLVEKFALIALEFVSFTDGRHYTHARLLKERGRYQGELRAVGDITIDQLFFLVRCGFDTIELADDVDLILATKNLNTFSDVYQGGLDTRVPVHLSRRSEPTTSG